MNKVIADNLNTLDSKFYGNISMLNEEKVISEMINFYDRAMTKPSEVLERYSRIYSPRGFLDSICYVWDSKRVGRNIAVKQAIAEKIEIGYRSFLKGVRDLPFGEEDKSINHDFSDLGF